MIHSCIHAQMLCFDHFLDANLIKYFGGKMPQMLSYFESIYFRVYIVAVEHTTTLNKMICGIMFLLA